MSVKQRIQDDLKAATANRNFPRLSSIRRLMNDMEEAEIHRGREFSDQEVKQFLKVVVKSRKEAAEQFNRVRRPDLAQEEEREIQIIDVYLRPEMTEKDITEVVQKEIQKLRSGDRVQIAEVIDTLRVKLVGRADMGLFAKVLRNFVKT